MSIKLKLLWLFLLYTTSLQAQHVEPSIRVISKVNKDGVWLRWAPTEFEVWKLGNTRGYILERFTLKQNGTIDLETPTHLNSIPIKPLKKNEFQNLASTQNEIGAVGELIYASENTSQKNDANTPAGILQKRDDQNNQFGIALLLCDLSYKTAEAAGLFFNDTSAKMGERYIYKIALAQTATPEKFEAGITVVDMIETPPLKPFNDLRANFEDRSVTLSWPTFTHKGVYGAYLVEKSIDGKTFHSITDLPYVSMSESVSDEAHFVDSLDVNGIIYSYRVKGISPFGEQGPPSNVVSGTGKENMTGFISISEIIPAEKKSINIKWNFPQSHENKISGFKISMASKADGVYADVTKKNLPKNARTFLLTSLNTSAYFQVKALGKNGKEISVSFPFFYHVEDNVPPLVPAKPAGRVSDTGVVTLTWEANKDKDLMGYRVFTANNPSNEFVEATQFILPTSIFIDTVDTNVLNTKKYYKIIAVDQNYNTSDYTLPISISIPDKIAPVPPVFSKTEASTKSIELTWILSSSNDVVKYNLLREKDGDTTRVKIAEWRKGKFVNNFSDNQLEQGVQYQYHLQVYDSTGNFSQASSKKILFESGTRKAATDFRATIDRENKFIKLSWAYTNPVKKSILYRRKNNEPFTFYQSFNNDIHEFVDDLLIINTTYSYKIQLILEGGIKTELSKELKVPY
jgi:uncharacterized protein